MNDCAAAWLEEAVTRDCWRKCRGRVLLATGKHSVNFNIKQNFGYDSEGLTFFFSWVRDCI